LPIDAFIETLQLLYEIFLTQFSRFQDISPYIYFVALYMNFSILNIFK